MRPRATSIGGVPHALDKTRTCDLLIRSVKDCVLERSLMHRNWLFQSVFVGLLYSAFTPVQLLLLLEPSVQSPEASPFSGVCRKFRRVADGARTRALRSHNPRTQVSTCCRALQNRRI